MTCNSPNPKKHSLRISRDSLSIIWQFAYGRCSKKHPIDDIDAVLRIRNAIPNILMSNYVPTIQFFHPDLIHVCLYRTLETRRFEKLMQPNPYIIGNPYFPPDLISHPNSVWSFVMFDLFSMLKKSVVRSQHTYLKVILRRLRRLVYGVSLKDSWNYALQNGFRFGFWTDPNSYVAHTALDFYLIERFCHQMSRAQFVF